MRVRAGCAAVLAAIVAAGAAHAAAKPTPQAVVRAWSKALNANDNEAAGALFALNAQVLQGSLAFRVTTHRIAVLFNSSLPCAGKIISMERHGTQVLAVFLLGERPKHRCDGPGGKAAAIFDVRNGKIVVWAQVPVPAPKPAASGNAA